MTMHHLWLASVHNISRFLKCINYKHEKCLQPCFTFQLSETSFGGLNFMKTPITCEEKSWTSEILQKSFQINHISRFYKELFGLKSLILRFGLKSRRIDVRHPISGASSGIGAETAIKFVEHGVSGLCITGRNEEALNNIKQRCVDGSNGRMKKENVIVVAGEAYNVSFFCFVCYLQDVQSKFININWSIFLRTK